MTEVKVKLSILTHIELYLHYDLFDVYLNQIEPNSHQDQIVIDV